MPNRELVSRANSVSMEHLATVLRQQTNAVADTLVPIFDAIEAGNLGGDVQRIAQSLFDQWCTHSMIVSPTRLRETIGASMRMGTRRADDFQQRLKEAGFTGEAAISAADRLAMLVIQGPRDSAHLAPIIMQLYAKHRNTLASQTAHILIARALVQRIGEDTNLWTERIGGRALSRLREELVAPLAAGHSYLDALSAVRKEREDFLPTVYLLSEFDWWYVPEDHRYALMPIERDKLRHIEDDLDVVVRAFLEELDGFQFNSLDVDVWRNVYQHYLPSDERQRLGGFYTPDELVDLVLDTAGYVAGREGLCQERMLDPACGSGAFVVGATARLLTHLEKKSPCHQKVHASGIAVWNRDEEILRIVQSCIHAVDVHPFAAFLTTLNILFLLLPRYVRVKQHNPSFTLDLHVYVADSLRSAVGQSGLFQDVNSRIQLVEHSLERYRIAMSEKFHWYVGNPPWGGVLKGPLAPVYDEEHKKQLAANYGASAKGKYDIYGLFLHRGTMVLTSTGRMGLITQSTFIDKEWGAGIRARLASQTNVQAIIDLNPFGQLFFDAMNTPCITATVNESPSLSGSFPVVLSHTPNAWMTRGIAARRHEVTEKVRQALDLVRQTDKPATVDFAEAFNFPRTALRTFSDKRWILAPPADAAAIEIDGISLSRLLEPRQGVTPGGVLDLFLLDQALTEDMEQALVYPAIKTRDTPRWACLWDGRALLYPYDRDANGNWQPAFTLPVGKYGIMKDALDFTMPFDATEQAIRGSGALTPAILTKLLNHRIGLDMVRYPKVAAYLLNGYERLSTRIFKQRSITSFNRRWYEYLWPRDQKVILASPRLVSPTLASKVRFALDTKGFLSDHACLFLVISTRTRGEFDTFKARLQDVAAHPLSDEDALKYVLAFANGTMTQRALVEGRRKTPKGSYQLDENYLSSVMIPYPRTAKDISNVIAYVENCITAAEENDATALAAAEASLATLSETMSAPVLMGVAADGE